MSCSAPLLRDSEEPTARGAQVIDAIGSAAVGQSAQTNFVASLAFVLGGSFFAVGAFAAQRGVEGLTAAVAGGFTPRQSNGWIWLPDILG